MDQESNQMEQHPVQCRNGCGFYSNAGTEGLCSVCYKDMIKKKQQPPTGMPSSLTPAPGTMASLSIDESSRQGNKSSSNPSNSLETASPTVLLPKITEKRSDYESEQPSVAIAEVVEDVPSSSSSSHTFLPTTNLIDPTQKEGKKKKSRCLICKSKVGLTGFTCRCGGLYCSIHRYSNEHECTFDYRELGAEEIRKGNPVIIANKVQKI